VASAGPAWLEQPLPFPPPDPRGCCSADGVSAVRLLPPSRREPETAEGHGAAPEWAAVGGGAAELTRRVHPSALDLAACLSLEQSRAGRGMYSGRWDGSAQLRSEMTHPPDKLVMTGSLGILFGHPNKEASFSY